MPVIVASLAIVALIAGAVVFHKRGRDDIARHCLRLLLVAGFVWLALVVASR